VLFIFPPLVLHAERSYHGEYARDPECFAGRFKSKDQGKYHTTEVSTTTNKSILSDHPSQHELSTMKKSITYHDAVVVFGRSEDAQGTSVGPKRKITEI
jgi:hypothetical protein